MHDAALALLLHRSHVLPCRLRAACLPVAWCHGWVGWGAKSFCVLFAIVLHLFCILFEFVLKMFCIFLHFFCRKLFCNLFAFVLHLFCICFAIVLNLFCNLFANCFANIFCRFSFQGGCICSQMCSRLPDGGRMSSGSVVYSRWVQARCRHSLNSFAEGPACRCWVRNWVPDSTMPFVALGPRSNDPPAVA